MHDRRFEDAVLVCLLFAVLAMAWLMLRAGLSHTSAPKLNNRRESPSLLLRTCDRTSMATTFASHGLEIKVGQTLRINGAKRKRFVVISRSPESDTHYTMVDAKGEEVGLVDCGSHFCTWRKRGWRVDFPRECKSVEIVGEPVLRA